ncbi:hypothetical protein U1Q18_034676 [Sarracenia purpurea var. burkii]
MKGDWQQSLVGGQIGAPPSLEYEGRLAAIGGRWPNRCSTVIGNQIWLWKFSTTSRPDHGFGDWDRHGFASSCPHITVDGAVVFTFGTSDFSALVRGRFWFEVRYRPRRRDRGVFGRRDLTGNLIAIKLRR